MSIDHVTILRNHLKELLTNEPVADVIVVLAQLVAEVLYVETDTVKAAHAEVQDFAESVNEMIDELASTHPKSAPDIPHSK